MYCDSLLAKGGAERTALKMSEWFQADLITSGFVREQFGGWNTSRVVDLGSTTAGIRNAFGSGNTGFQSIFRAGYIESALRFYLSRRRWDFDVNIFGGSYSIYAAKKEGFNVLYCHSPNRTLYDQWDRIYDSLNPLQKPLWKAYHDFFKPRDQKIMREHIKLMIANSKVTAERLKKYYGLKDFEMLVSPISTNQYKFVKFGDFYLAVSRLIPEKRVDVIVEAFTRMPSKKLVVVGDGPQMPYIRKIAGDSPNISLLGSVGEDVLTRLYGECLATIFIPYMEDYGMVPLEGNSAGKPCISVNEEGCRETVLPGKTGFFVEPTADSIIEQVKALDVKMAQSMKEECVSWARRFDDSVFRQRLLELIEKHRQ